MLSVSWDNQCGVISLLAPGSTCLVHQVLIPQFEPHLLPWFCLIVLTCFQGLGSSLLVYLMCLGSFYLSFELPPSVIPPGPGFISTLCPTYGSRRAAPSKLFSPQFCPHLSPSGPIALSATCLKPKLLLHAQLTLYPQLCRWEATRILGLNSVISKYTWRWWPSGLQTSHLRN